MLVGYMPTTYSFSGQTCNSTVRLYTSTWGPARWPRQTRLL